jgi:hypothetical protein
VEDLGHGLAHYLEEVAENAMLHITVQDAQAWYEHVAAIITDQKIGGPRVQPPRPALWGARDLRA